MVHQDIKPAAAASYSCLFIGQDRTGRWVVKDARSLCGGLFTNRTEAIRLQCMNANAALNPSLCCQTAWSWMEKLRSSLHLSDSHLEGLGLAAPTGEATPIVET